MQQRNSSAPSSGRSKFPAYCLHARSGRAYVTIAGRQVSLGEYGSPESRDEYDRVIAEWLASGRPRDASNGQIGLSVNELILAFLGHADKRYRKRSGERCGERTSEYEYLRVSLRELKRLYGLTAADEFKPSHLEAVRDSMIRSGLARTGVNGRISRIVRMFKWGVGKGQIDPMTHHALSQVLPLQPFETDAQETDPVKPVLDEHVDPIAPHVSRQIWAMVKVQRLTGMRPGEVCRMRTGAIDRTQKVWIYSLDDHKTAHRGHSRVVPIGPKAQAILKPWLRDDPNEFLFSPAEAEKERRKAQRAARKTKVQPSQRKARTSPGKRRPRDHYRVDAYCKAIKRACAKAGVPQWSPNQLRHAAATEIQKLHGIEAASIILGHRSLTVTQIYAERNEARAIDVASQYG
ncbi:site-specific tyrosine recombinase XerC [Planctomycetes bacterium MalM25]|nr:site-specific tyrosine recombinase XerC [Planctomycetes bacterium MalM25]